MREPAICVTIDWQRRVIIIISPAVPAVPPRCAGWKGWIVDWENPDDTALSKKDGTALWNGILGLLDQKFQQHIDVEKLRRVSRASF